jgi:hemerythrin-like domain-containing protein
MVRSRRDKIAAEFMLRNKNLIPLSHQHHHALALCVRIDRAIQAGEVDLAAWQEEIRLSFDQEIQYHFAAEEKELFPVATQFPELQPLVNQLLTEHATLRQFFSQANSGDLDIARLNSFAELLSSHIRKEERQLFEGLQQRLNAQALDTLGTALEQALRDASEVCLLPNPATRLRPRN